MLGNRAWATFTFFWPRGAYIAGYRVDICFASVSYYYNFLTSFVSPIISTSTGRIFTVLFRYGCRWTIWTSIFEFSRDVAIATKFRFLKFRIFAITPKPMWDRHMIQGKENVRLLSSGTIRIDLRWPWAKTAFGLYYSFRSNLLKKVPRIVELLWIWWGLVIQLIVELS